MHKCNIKVGFGNLVFTPKVVNTPMTAVPIARFHGAIATPVALETVKPAVAT